MRPYGVRREDRGCCPGHDKFPSDTYNNRRSKKARAEGIKISHRIERHRAAEELRVAAQSEDLNGSPSG